MAEHLRMLDKWIPSEKWPAVACPVCHDGHLTAQEIQTKASTASKRQFGVTGDLQDLDGTFSGLLKCAVASCGAFVTVAGDWMMDFDLDEDGDTIDTEAVRLKYANPALCLLVPPSGTPPRVSAAIEQASSVVWLDPSSAANRLRVAVEELLTANRVPRTGPKKLKGPKSVRRPLTAHDRINKFRAKQPDVADALEAVKWIGNSGSHESSLTVEDILNGADILDLALRSLYDKTDVKLARKVATINKRKGLPRKKAGA